MILENNCSVEVTHHFLVRKDQFRMSMWKTAVWVNKKMIKEQFPGDYDETAIYFEVEQVAQDTFEGNFSSSEAENKDHKNLDVSYDREALNSIPASYACTSNHNLEYIETSRPPYRKCKIVKRRSARFQDLDVVAVDDWMKYDKAMKR